MAGSPADSATKPRSAAAKLDVTVVPISTPSGGGAVRVGARVVETPPARGDEAAHTDQ